MNDEEEIKSEAQKLHEEVLEIDADSQRMIQEMGEMGLGIDPNIMMAMFDQAAQKVLLDKVFGPEGSVGRAEYERDVSIVINTEHIKPSYDRREEILQTQKEEMARQQLLQGTSAQDMLKGGQQ